MIVQMFLALSALLSMLWTRPQYAGAANTSWTFVGAWMSYYSIVALIYILFGLSVGLFDRIWNV